MCEGAVTLGTSVMRMILCKRTFGRPVEIVINPIAGCRGAVDDGGGICFMAQHFVRKRAFFDGLGICFGAGRMAWYLRSRPIFAEPAGRPRPSRRKSSQGGRIAILAIRSFPGQPLGNPSRICGGVSFRGLCVQASRAAARPVNALARWIAAGGRWNDVRTVAEAFPVDQCFDVAFGRRY